MKASVDPFHVPRGLSSLLDVQYDRLSKLVDHSSCELLCATFILQHNAPFTAALCNQSCSPALVKVALLAQTSRFLEAPAFACYKVCAQQTVHTTAGQNKQSILVAAPCSGPSG